MKRTSQRTLLALSLLAFATPALAQSLGEKSGVNSTLGIAPKTEDFVKEVAISDMYEIASNKIGQTKGSADQKTFAAMMVTDHTKTSNELKELVKSANIQTEMPTQLDSSHQSMLDKLNAANGDDFVSTFTSQQVDAHKDAVNLFERYSKGGENPALKDWAGKTLPTLQHHLEMAQKLQK